MGDNTFKSKANKNSVLINNANLKTGTIHTVNQILKQKSTTHWHAFIILAPKLDRNDLLQELMNYVYPADLIPVKYQRSGDYVMFLARNCSDAIKKLCKEKLLLPNKSYPKRPLKCEIILRYDNCKQQMVTFSQNIADVLFSLYDSANKTFDLSRFHLNTDLNEYTPLMQPKVLDYALRFSDNLKPTCLKLNDNDIRSLVPMKALSNSQLTHLDLRNNSLDSIIRLNPLKKLNIKEIWLDGNPFCDNFEASTYISKIKEIFPNLEVLDGIRLHPEDLPYFNKNFLCNDNGYSLVDEFVKHYFTLYDTNRHLLENMYSPKAMFSMTSCFQAEQNAAKTDRWRNYEVNARNSNKSTCFSNNETHLFRGHRVIAKKLMELPRCMHDIYSLTTDLMYFNDKDQQAVISVGGAFCEIIQNELDAESVLGFTRVFFLSGNFSDEWSISNEMFHVFNIPSPEPYSFNIVQRWNESLTAPRNEGQKSILQKAFSLMTGLKSEWSRIFLDDCNYDIKKALCSFVGFYRDNKVPLDAFNSLNNVGSNHTETSKSTVEIIHSKNGSDNEPIGMIENQSQTSIKDKGLTESFNSITDNHEGTIAKNKKKKNKKQKNKKWENKNLLIEIVTKKGSSSSILGEAEPEILNSLNFENNSSYPQRLINQQHNWHIDTVDPPKFYIKVEKELEEKLIETNHNWRRWSPEMKKRMLQVRPIDSNPDKCYTRRILLNSYPKYVKIPQARIMFGVQAPKPQAKKKKKKAIPSLGPRAS